MKSPLLVIRCDRCKTTVHVPEADLGHLALPDGWDQIIEYSAYTGPKGSTYEICGTCAAEHIRMLRTNEELADAFWRPARAAGGDRVTE